MEKATPIRFVITKIEIENFKVAETVSENRDSIKLGTGGVFNFDTTNHVIAPSITFVYKNDKEVLFELTAQCSFMIEQVGWEAFKEPGKGTLIPVAFLQHLAFNAINTVRGIVFCKSEGTPFADYIIPMINVENIVKENILIPDAN
ncbi:MAG: hypothetical protein K2N86_03960 [Rikenellaceae bacterium]|nr:hypothetical protein [Rikenellaceae bacterium]